MKKSYTAYKADKINRSKNEEPAQKRNLYVRSEIFNLKPRSICFECTSTECITF